MKKILLLIAIAIGFTVAYAYDDDNRCNEPNVTLAEGIYITSGTCQQTGFVCRLASEPSGTITFWLGTSSDRKKIHTTKLPTYYPKQNESNEIDPNHPNHELRLILAPGIGNSNIFGTAVMASQILSAKSDKAQVSVIYTFVPDGQLPSLNSIRLLSISRVD